MAHDVRIEVMRPQDVARLKEPMCPEPEVSEVASTGLYAMNASLMDDHLSDRMQVHILLPPLAKLRTVVERIRPLAGEVVAIRASSSGCLQISAQTESARVDVAWNGLTNPIMGTLVLPNPQH